MNSLYKNLGSLNISFAWKCKLWKSGLINRQIFSKLLEKNKNKSMKKKKKTKSFFPQPFEKSPNFIFEMRRKKIGSIRERRIRVKR